MATFDSIFDVSTTRGVNFDLWDKSGAFFFTETAASLSVNAPVSKAGSLLVLATNNSSHVYQIYMVYGSSTIYLRSKVGKTWTTWNSSTSGSSSSGESSSSSITVVSTDLNNIITEGTDGGAYISSESVPTADSVGTSLVFDTLSGTLKLIAADNETELSSVVIPSGGSVLQSAELEDGSLKLTWLLTDESTTETTIDLSSLIDEYTSGTGILIENKVVSINAEWLKTQIPDVSSYATKTELTTGLQSVTAQIPDVSGYATKTELTTLEESLPDKYCLAYITSDTGTSRIQNEVTGSGPMYTHTDGTRSYVGVNNGGADSIAAQIYSIDLTSKEGTRLNVFKKGIFYHPNKSSSDADYVIDDANQELAVKGDIPDITGLATKQELLDVESEIPSTAGLVASVVYDADSGDLKFYDADESLVQTVNISSSASIIKNVELKDNELVFTWTTEGEGESTTSINLADLIPVYTGGDGIEIENNTISVNADYILTKVGEANTYATKTEVTEAVATLENSLPDNYCIATIESDTGKSIIQNEETGGGPKYWHTDGTRAYTGVNNGGADGIGVQTYVINNDTKIGTRINVYAKGAFYVNGKANTDADYVADASEREIAVKGDLSELQGTIEAKIPSLEGYATTTEVTAEIASQIAVAVAGVEDKIPDTTNLVASAVYNISTGTLSLRSSSDVELGTVTIPSTGTVLQAAELQEDGKLKMTWVLADSSTTETTVDLSDLIDVYKAGTGLTETDNTFSIDTDYLAGVINTALTDINNTLTSLSNTVATNTANITTLQGLVATNTENISNLQTTVNSHTTDITNLRTSVDATTSNITSINNELTTLKTTVEGHTTNISSLQTTVEENTTNISSLQTTVNSYSDQLTTLQSTVENNTSNITSIQENVSTITNNITELTQKVSEITYDITLFFDSEGMANGVHTFLPENASSIQLIKIEADGVGTDDLSISMAGDISLTSQSISITTSSAACTVFAGYAVVFNVSGAVDQTKIAALVRCTLS